MNKLEDLKAILEEWPLKEEEFKEELNELLNQYLKKVIGEIENFKKVATGRIMQSLT